MKRIVAALLLAALCGAAHAMTRSAAPPAFTIPFGADAGSAYINYPIPTPSQIGILNCAASLTDGFPPKTMQPATAGGCPPFGQDMNGILEQITLWNQWNSFGGMVPYNSSLASAISGYPEGAVLSQASNPYCYWVSQVDNNASDPDTGGANWTAACPGGGIATTPSTEIGGNPNQQAVTTTPFLLQVNSQIAFIAGYTNTGPMQINVNGDGLVNFYKQTSAGPTIMVGGEAVAGQVVTGFWDGAEYQCTSCQNIVNVVPSTVGLGAPTNLRINLSASSGQLTVAVKGANGSNPSAANPVTVVFRDQNNANGTAIFGQITAAASMTLASTSSQGCQSAQTYCRLWVTLICQTQSGTSCTSILVGLSAQSGLSSGNPVCYPLSENLAQGTGSGTTGGTALKTIQTSVSSLSGVSVRIAAYVEATWTSGTGWTLPASPSEPLVQLFGPGVKKPCDPVQGPLPASSSTAGSVASSTKVQVSPTVAITPQSAADLIAVHADASGFVENNSVTCLAALSRGTSSFTALTAENTLVFVIGSISFAGTGPLDGFDYPTTTSPITYAPFIWAAAGTCYWNAVSGVSFIQATEIQG